jgi:hypothetical protein
MNDLTQVATGAVAALIPLIHLAADAGAKEAGKLAATVLLDSFKRMLGAGPAQEAASDLAAQPSDADRQAALRVQMRKLLEANPEFAQEVQGWLAQALPLVQGEGSTQIAQASGNYSTVIQLSGSNNTVQR